MPCAPAPSPAGVGCMRLQSTLLALRLRHGLVNMGHVWRGSRRERREPWGCPCSWGPEVGGLYEVIHAVLSARPGQPRETSYVWAYGDHVRAGDKRALGKIRPIHLCGSRVALPEPTGLLVFQSGSEPASFCRAPTHREVVELATHQARRRPWGEARQHPQVAGSSRPYGAPGPRPEGLEP